MNREWSVVLQGDGDGEVLSRIEASRCGLTVVRSCHELSETLGTVLAGVADAVVFVGPPEDLTVSLLAEMRLAGAATVVMSEGPAQDFFGLVPLAPTASVDLIAEALRLSAEAQPVGEGPASEDGDEEPETSESTASPIPEAEREPTPAGSGRLLVVWGPAGAPGRTTVAVNSAAELARAGLSVCLVDADTVAASVGAVLGLVEETSGLSRACRAAERGRPVQEVLADLVDVVGVGGHDMAVLTGIPRPDRWLEVRRAALAEVLRGLLRTYDVVVADIAAPLEFDDPGFLEDGAPQRHGAAAECLERADEILAVGRADAVGFPRLIREQETLGQLGSAGRVRVVINGVRRESSGRNPEEQVLEAWSRYGSGPPPIGLLPWDPEACGRSLFSGGLWCEEAPSSPVRQALVAALADTESGAVLRDAARPSRRSLPDLAALRAVLGRVRGRTRAAGSSALSEAPETGTDAEPVTVPG